MSKKTIAVIILFFINPLITALLILADSYGVLREVRIITLGLLIFELSKISFEYILAFFGVDIK